MASTGLFGFNFIKNASPLWYIERISPEHLEYVPVSKRSLGEEFVFTMVKEALYLIPMPIYRKITNIRWGVKKEGASFCFITFSDLTLSEAEDDTFSVNNAIVVYAGWWGWWALDKTAIRVFDGIIIKTKYWYEETGIRIELELQEKASTGVGAVVDSFTIGLYEATNPASALKIIAEHLGVKLLIDWDGDPAKKTFQEYNNKYLAKDNTVAALPKPWIERLVINGKATYTTLGGILDNMARVYQKQWFVEKNVLFFGLKSKSKITISDELNSNPQKMFLYRTGHQAILPPQAFTHIDQETFTSIEIEDPMAQPYSGISQGGIDPGTKKPYAVRDTRDSDVIDIYHDLSLASPVKNTPTLMNEIREYVNQANEQAKGTFASKDKIIAKTGVNAKNDTLAIPSATLSSLEAKGELSGLVRNLSLVGTSKMRIKGVLGDPRLYVSEEIYIEGCTKHSAIWTIHAYEQNIDVGDMQYSMTIECERSKSSFISMVGKDAKDAINKKHKEKVAKNQGDDSILMFEAGTAEARSRELLIRETEKYIAGVTK